MSTLSNTIPNQKQKFFANFMRKIGMGVLMPLCLFMLDVGLSSCTKPPPRHIDNLCSIFREYPSWYWDAQEVQKHWGLPIPVLMSIIYQESRFHAHAKPPRKKLLWIIPWFRPTSAYGYSQAVKDTWRRYKQQTGHKFASRDAFGNAADFIGWYADRAHRRAGISKSNAYQVYLAYHEGIGGYQRRTYLRKRWLIHVAQEVSRRARTYRSQLYACRTSLPKKPFWHIW